MPPIVSGRSLSCTRFRHRHVVGASLVLAWLALSTSLRADIPAAFEAFQFLLGRWTGTGDQAGATGGFTFALDVQNQVIVRTNYSNTPATADRPASRHDDLMVIYIDGAVVKGDYFDSEGHVIHYLADATPDRVVFISDVKSSEPRYRLSYRRGSNGATLTGTFEVAPAGEPEAFAPYLSWRARKVK
jgi:hypothetical protein